jgi:hypothetical protein
MDSFKIKVRIGTSEMELTVSSTTKISDLKRMIQGRANVAFIKKKLVYEGNALADEVTLGEINIQSGHTISVENI